MAPLKDAEPPALQAFETKDGKPLQSLPAHFCPKTGDLCIFWQNLQNTFHGVDYVNYMPREWDNAKRVLFMVDQHGDVLQPLRIRCIDQFTYKVFYHKHQGELKPALEFESRYLSWIGVSTEMEIAARTVPRIEFVELSGNGAYLHSKLMEQLRLLKEVGIKVEVNGKNEDQILNEMQDYQREGPVLDYQNSCRNFLSGADILEPCRFLLLPEDLGSWDDSDATTHQFRLYFLCDIISLDPQQTNVPQHMHLSNHPGYKLNRPQEFFQKFGSYTLLMLRMAKQGDNYTSSVIPPLDTFEILWSLDPGVTSNHLTKDTIGPLIAKSISYLETLPVPKCGLEEWLEGWESTTIKDYLILEGSDTLGGLYRSTAIDNSWYWTCKEHGEQSLTPGTLNSLEDFVRRCGGHYNAQRASLRIDLRSREDTDELCTLLKNTEQRLDISIRIDWNMSRLDLADFMKKITDTDVNHLELDGVTQSMHPQGFAEYRSDLFYDHAEIGGKLGSVTLLHYPQPQEQYTYFASWRTRCVFWLHWKMTQQGQAETRNWWADLRERKADDFVKAIVGNPSERDSEAVKRLQDFLAKTRCQPVGSIGALRSSWCGELDLQEGALLKFQVCNLAGLAEKDYYKSKVLRVSLEALESVRLLAVDVDDPIIGKDEIARMVQASPQLQELEISQLEGRALERLETVLELWQGRSNLLQLTLLERETHGRGRIVVQAFVSGHTDRLPGSDTLVIKGPDVEYTKFQDRAPFMSPKINFLQWNIDHVSTPLTDTAVALLGMAVEHNPSAMISFSLDISPLSLQGLTHIQKILQRSALEFLHIHCLTLELNLISSVRQILALVQWPTLQSLELTGPAVNEWIELLTSLSMGKTTESASLRDLQLQHFGIYGTGAEKINLTHSSMLFIHQLVYANPSVELVLKNARQEVDGDLDLVLENHCS
ncbi:hypothetical protein BGZ93_000635 [Podila epicladia]|nr:hypothetical protein BGZ93_000635 [Podila epicladia]